MTGAVLTLVASDQALTKSHLKDAAGIAEAYNIEVGGAAEWLCADKAADLTLSDRPSSAALAHLREAMEGDKIDVLVSGAQNRRKALLLADMDSTIVAEETLDELAAFAGLKEQVSEITAKAMNGELDFHGAIRERVGLLKGLPVSALEETLAATVVNAGAEVLVGTMKAHGATCVLVSGGFTFFTKSIAEKVGFDFNHGNTLGIEGGELTGVVVEPILDKFAKVDFLEQYCADLNIAAADCMTIGDGANDIPMLKKAGLGVGYRPKPAVAEEVASLIRFGGLSAALYAQGYRESDIRK